MRNVVIHALLPTISHQNDKPIATISESYQAPINYLIHISSDVAAWIMYLSAAQLSRYLGRTPTHSSFHRTR
jgi:hypothetical protein